MEYNYFKYVFPFFVSGGPFKERKVNPKTWLIEWKSVCSLCVNSARLNFFFQWLNYIIHEYRRANMTNMLIYAWLTCHDNLIFKGESNRKPSKKIKQNFTVNAYLGFNIIEHFTLSVNQHCHIKKNLHNGTNAKYIHVSVKNFI